jgi:hypothetical protein
MKESHNACGALALSLCQNGSGFVLFSFIFSRMHKAKELPVRLIIFIHTHVEPSGENI